MVRRLFVAALLLSGFVPSLAAAQTLPDTSTVFAATSAVNAMMPPARAAEEPFGQLQLPRPVMPKAGTTIGTKALLSSLYATTATMQMLDVNSTLKSLGRGAVEGNPVMAGLVGNRAMFVATKAGIAAAAIYAAHKMAKNNKVGAVLTLVAMNSAYAMIVKHNYAIANR